ncbi:hypothetical protein MKW94_005139 [Papaver nudicaule]|uniref:Uncharacterized protein n=1 Tax=Papaver nudicaule TaxID=74823 RepID=A0AA41V816_PAPNU|nr:hypothetical protein [Papaver nudicaule]
MLDCRVKKHPEREKLCGLFLYEFVRLLLVAFCLFMFPDSDSKESTSGTTQDELTEWQNNWDLDEGNTKETEALGINHQDPFWEKLKLAAEKKVGPESAEKFCKAFQTIHKKLVFNELSEDAAQRFINSTAGYSE